MKEHGFTKLDTVYPGYTNFTRHPDGTFTLTVRGDRDDSIPGTPKVGGTATIKLTKDEALSFLGGCGGVLRG